MVDARCRPCRPPWLVTLGGSMLLAACGAASGGVSANGPAQGGVVAIPAGATSLGGEMPAVLTTASGLVSASAPAGADWACQPRAVSRADVGVDAEDVVCELQASGQYLLLVARDYSVRPEDAVPSTRLCGDIYRRQWEREMRGTSEYLTAPTQVRGRDACTTAWTAIDAQQRTIQIRELVVVDQNHVLLVQAMGDVATFAARGPIVDAWFTGARFSRLGP